MGSFDTFIILMTAAVILVGLAVKVRIPYPIVLVIGGLLIEFIPGIKPIEFDPDLLQAIVLPPILYYAAFWISNREFLRTWKEILSLALGLVLATTILIGFIFKWLFPQYPWALAFAFGAIISPPDAVVASAFLKRYNIGLRLQTILEGESLVNDATGIVLFKLAIVALLTGTFSIEAAGIQFAQVAFGGIAVGAVLGYIMQALAKRFFDPVSGVIFSFALPYMIYVAAQALNVSGVLAVVISGLFASHYVFHYGSSKRRVFGYVTWDIFYILLNCFVFIMLGSQLKAISKNMTSDQMLRYFFYAVLITLAMTLIRLSWVVFTGFLSQLYTMRHRWKYAFTLGKISIGNSTILGLSGMRGVVSLTLALAIPYLTLDGTVIEGREEVIYTAFMVILITILVPPIILPAAIKWLKISNKGLVIGSDTREGLLRIARDEISKMHFNSMLSDEERQFLKNYFESRHRFLEITSKQEPQMHSLESARLQVLQSQRSYLLKLWEDGTINDQMFAYLELEVDLDEFQHSRAEI